MHHLGIFDTIFIGMYLLLALIRVPREYADKHAHHVESRKSLVERTCLLLVFTGSTTMPVLYFFTPWFDFADFSRDVRFGWLGTLFAALGIVLFWMAHRDLGREFSPTLELKDQHRLVTSGIYSRIRHPMYSALFLISTAQLLLIANAVVAPAFLIAFTILYCARVDHEERMMTEHFGQAYADYCLRTRRLLPALRN